VLERTLGVPIFQEQVIRLAMVAAGFTGGEADQLRRAITNWGRNSKLLTFEQKLTEGMLRRGYSEDYAGASSTRSRASAATAFPSPTRRASPCSPTCPPGSSAITRRPSTWDC
jgi:error-prone DNA polymerase